MKYDDRGNIVEACGCIEAKVLDTGHYCTNLRRIEAKIKHASKSAALRYLAQKEFDQQDRRATYVLRAILGIWVGCVVLAAYGVLVVVL